MQFKLKNFRIDDLFCRPSITQRLTHFRMCVWWVTYLTTLLGGTDLSHHEHVTAALYSTSYKKNDSKGYTQHRHTQCTRYIEKNALHSWAHIHTEAYISECERVQKTREMITWMVAMVMFVHFYPYLFCKWFFTAYSVSTPRYENSFQIAPRVTLLRCY